MTINRSNHSKKLNNLVKTSKILESKIKNPKIKKRK